MKRLTIYAFYDPHGLVDDYVMDCVAALAEHSDRVLVVSNGPLDAESAGRLATIPSVTSVERANEGFDIWGYKHGLEFVGWGELERYDEVVLMNSTIAGPLYPLAEMFDAMDARDLDFWGLTAHSGEDYDPWDLLPTGKIERHIQSYFTAIRKRLLRSAEFHAYWDSLPLIRSYTDAVALHEAVFTHKFEQLGFRWSCYVDSTDLEDITSYPLMFLPEPVLMDKRCPFFKRKALFLEAQDLAATRAGSTATMVRCLDRLGYDLQRVLPNVIRTSHQSDIRLALNALVTLKAPANGDTTHLSKVRVLARVRDIEGCIALERFRTVLEQCGDFIIMADPAADEGVIHRLTAFQARLVRDASLPEFVREVGRVTRSLEPLLLIGSTGGASELSAYSTYEAGLRALADSPAVLASAVAGLEDSSFAGALASPLIDIAPGSRAVDWRRSDAPLAAVLPLLGINVPLSPEKPAWGPAGGIVLAGPGMLATDWDAVAEAMSDLGRPRAEALFNSLIPFIVQSHGMLLAYALPESMTPTAVLANHLREALQATRRKQHRRAGRFYHNSGAGYSEDESTLVRPTLKSDGSVTFSWQAPTVVESVRFDPVEGAGVICRGVTATVDATPTEIVPVNCLRFGSELDIFMTTDPIYDVRGVTPGAKVVVTMDAIGYVDECDFAAPPPSENAHDTYGGPLPPALAAIQADLIGMRDAYDTLRDTYDALRDAFDATVDTRLRRRIRALIARGDRLRRRA